MQIFLILGVEIIFSLVRCGTPDHTCPFSNSPLSRPAPRATHPGGIRNLIGGPEWDAQIFFRQSFRKDYNSGEYMDDTHKNCFVTQIPDNL